MNDSAHLAVEPMEGPRKTNEDATEDDNKTILITDLPPGCKYHGDTKFDGGKMVQHGEGT